MSDLGPGWRALSDEEKKKLEELGVFPTSYVGQGVWRALLKLQARLEELEALLNTR